MSNSPLKSLAGTVAKATKPSIWKCINLYPTVIEDISIIFKREKMAFLQFYLFHWLNRHNDNSQALTFRQIKQILPISVFIWVTKVLLP